MTAPETPSPPRTRTARSEGPAEGLLVDRTDEGEPDAGESPARRSDRGSFLRELPVLIVVAFVLAFLLRTFVVQVFWIPSSSMDPTLQINDRILVDKVTFRFREVRRGEVVVFEGDARANPEDRGPIETVLRGVGQLIGIAPANARDYVKRVVGLPGDEIRIDDQGRVSVNGVALEEPYVVHADARSHGPITVPEGTLFFLGDNRPNSSDSRFLLGFVERDQLVGKAFLVIWPVGRAGFLRGPHYAPIPDAGQALGLVPSTADGGFPVAAVA